MKKVKRDELLSLGAYEQVRDRFRARIIQHKKLRRLLVGPEMSIVFEDHDTVLLQVQEILRSERITEASAIAHELAVYNDLVPSDGTLLATLMIEINDAPTRDARRGELVGLDTHVRLEIGDLSVRAEFAPEGLQTDRIAVVQYVTFRMPEPSRALLTDATKPARFIVDHPRYAYTLDLDHATRASLANDLDPANAEGSR